MKLDIMYELETRKPWTQGQAAAEQRIYRDALEQIDLADKMGFATVWMVEHHFREERSHCSAPEVFLGAVSQRTKNIRLGHGVALLPKPFNHPVRLAERAAALDILSDGRVEFGTGRSTLFEQDGFDVDPAKAVEQWEEAIRMLPKMWTQEKFSHDGPSWKVRERNVLPKPMQNPHPPLWTAATSDARQRQAGELGVGTLGLTLVQPIEACANRIKLFREGQKNPKHVSTAVNNRFAAYTVVHCAESRQKAIDNGAYECVHWFYKCLAKNTLEWEGHLWSPAERAQRFPRMNAWANEDKIDVAQFDAEAQVLVGSPDEMIRKMERYEEIGVDHLMCYQQYGGLPHEHVMKSIELIGKYVIPHFAEKEKAKARKAAAA